MPRPAYRGMVSSSGMIPSRGRPAASMASSTVRCRDFISFFRHRFTTRWTWPLGKRLSSMTVRWASRRLLSSVVETTTARSAPPTASWNPAPSPAGASMRQ